MNRCVLIVLFFLFIFDDAVSQIRLERFTIERNETFEIQGTDILVADTLILKDSARIILNPLKNENFIHAKKLIVGRGCAIYGKGTNGISGKVGSQGTTPGGPCRDGVSGQPGTPGTDGRSAVNLYLYCSELIISGNLLIDLAGGDGGEGGMGGPGSDGNPGTKLCQGGSGGNGGNGAAGGNGGNAGNLTIASRYGEDLRRIMGDKIIVRSFGGFAGLGGEGGSGGQRGLSSSKDGDQGRKGLSGQTGKPGKPGAIFFERK